MDAVEKLRELSDGKYAEFQRRLIPDIPPESIIGVRTPELRQLASKMLRDGSAEDYIKNVKHKYFDENQLHAFILCKLKDFQRCIDEVERFLPYVDNWATCDQLSPAVFKNHSRELLPYISRWLKSGRTYTVRFGVGMLMRYFLDDDYKKEYLDKVCSVKSEEYYINMMLAWYIATALAKQWDDAVKVLEGKRLSPWVHNKAIQKARESFRITPEQKEYLKTLKQ